MIRPVNWPTETRIGLSERLHRLVLGDGAGGGGGGGGEETAAWNSSIDLASSDSLSRSDCSVSGELAFRFRGESFYSSVVVEVATSRSLLYCSTLLCIVFWEGSPVLVLGFAYPAYECFKTVELNRPEVEQLRFWCQYWILVAALTVLERVGDAFISWIPMYSEAKVAFFIYLWYPKTRGATYVYDTFLRPYIASRETEIDRNLLELKTRAGDVVFLYWQKAASYGQTRVFEILQYIASQAPSEQSRQQAAMLCKSNKQIKNQHHHPRHNRHQTAQPDQKQHQNQKAKKMKLLVLIPILYHPMILPWKRLSA
ncbi:HVA22-like protein i [Apostasia shenzhenica]|uniref:HVA22-like protein n=1 Tax=Apostasia shenzhenica TaxID=1088818 RepID=A0A2I0AWX2_9ASPA|nr:HVA22-like protein i [Apostasia shenzhenica]